MCSTFKNNPAYNCGENYNLFQIKFTDEQIANWYPLQCMNTDYNCVPTALALTGIIPSRKKAERYSDKYPAGINLVDFTKLLKQQLTRLDLIEKVNIPIYNIFDLFEKLEKGNVTILACNYTHHKIGHAITVAKNNSGQLFIFDGQTQKYYTNYEIHKYLFDFCSFNYWCSNVKLKRKQMEEINIMIRKMKTVEPVRKRIKISNSKQNRTKIVSKNISASKNPDSKNTTSKNPDSKNTTSKNSASKNTTSKKTSTSKK